jgi:hypothetical protein
LTVKAEAGKIHILWLHRCIEPGENAPDAIRILNAQFRGIPAFGKTPKGLASERSDHV